MIMGEILASGSHCVFAPYPSGIRIQDQQGRDSQTLLKMVKTASCDIKTLADWSVFNLVIDHGYI